MISPPNGWVQNTNNWPYRAAGAFSPKPEQYPRYMDMFGENYRGLHALKLLQRSKGLDAREASGGGLRQLPAGLRRADPAACCDAYGDLPAGRSAHGDVWPEPIAVLARLGLSLERDNPMPQILASLLGGRAAEDHLRPGK